MRYYVIENEDAFIGRCSEYEFLETDPCDSPEEALDLIQDLVEFEEDRLACGSDPEAYDLCEAGDERFEPLLEHPTDEDDYGFGVIHRTPKGIK